MACKQQAIATALCEKTASKQGAPARGIGPPDIAGETTYQHCFEVNFA